MPLHELGVRRRDHAVDFIPQPLLELNISIIKLGLLVKLLDLLERLVEPDEPVLRLAPLCPAAARDRSKTSFERSCRARLLRKASVEECRDKRRPDLEIRRLGRPHTLVEAVFGCFAENVDDGGREDCVPDERDVVEEEDGACAGSTAEDARARVERAEEDRKDVVWRE